MMVPPLFQSSSGFFYSTFLSPCCACVGTCRNRKLHWELAQSGDDVAYGNQVSPRTFAIVEHGHLIPDVTFSTRYDAKVKTAQSLAPLSLVPQIPQHYLSTTPIMSHRSSREVDREGSNRAGCLAGPATSPSDLSEISGLRQQIMGTAHSIPFQL
jgi:hypothetical protein